MCATCRVFNVGIDVATEVSKSKGSERWVWQRSNAFEEQHENCKMMECLVFTYAFNHQNCLTKCFIACDGFVLIPVTKAVGGNMNVTKKNIENLVRS
jgi:hypothetical protein